MPKVTVVMPIYNSRKYLVEAIESIRNQTYQDWELLAINEYGSNDGSREIIENYHNKDSRIHLVQNEERLGLARSLNKGIDLAKGEYIARMDADDLSHPTRFEKQVIFMEQNPKVIVCGTYQHHFGPDVDWIHKPATDPEQCKANLLFFCDLCHSTLMLRRDALIKNNLYYNPDYLAEDFELWTRVVSVGDIANIPEVLGEYRWGEDNITLEKLEKLNQESGEIVANSLTRNLGVVLKDKEYSYFRNWHNPMNDVADKEIFLKGMEGNLKKIYKANLDKQYYNEQALLNSIGTKWRWVKYGEPFNHVVYVKNINSVFANRFQFKIIKRCWYFWINNPSMKLRIRKILKKIRGGKA